MVVCNSCNRCDARYVRSPDQFRSPVEDRDRWNGIGETFERRLLPGEIGGVEGDPSERMLEAKRSRLSHCCRRGRSGRQCRAGHKLRILLDRLVPVNTVRVRHFMHDGIYREHDDGPER